MYDERGVWIDDVTGVPDIMMPPNMVQPSTAGYHPRPSPVPAGITPQAPQHIAPQMAAPQQQLAPGTIPGYDPQNPGAFANLRGPDIPPPLTQDEVSQGYNAMARPTPWTAGKIASTALTAPIKGFAGLLAELHGALGIPTVADTAARYQALYSNPNKTESRAFGVGTAEEPGFGDRFMGVFDGSARRQETAGMVMRQRIGAMNQARKDAFTENKSVIDIVGGTIQNERNRRKGELEAKYGELQTILGVQGQQQGLMKGSQDMQAQNLQMILTKLRIGTAQEKADAMQRLTEIFNSPDPEVRAAARGLTGGAAAVTQDQYMPPTAVQTLQDVLGKGITNQAGTLGNIEKAATLPDPVTGLDPAAALAEKARVENEELKRQLAEEKTAREERTAKESLLAQAVDDVMAQFATRIPPQGSIDKQGFFDRLLAPYTGKPDLAKERESALKLRDQVIAELKKGGLTREQATQIFPGGKTLQDFLGSNYDAEIGAVVRPSQTEPLAPAGGTGMDRRVGEPEAAPTPQPSPTASRGSEADRQQNATRVSQVIARFDEKWKREREPLGIPLRGTAYYRDLDANLARLGLKRETAD